MTAIDTAQWEDRSNGFTAYVDPNVLVLPNGRVMVTGDGGAEGNGPQIWNPSSGGSWTGRLASEPAVRGYHSTAMLLPDGRVITGGGGAVSELRVYCPPYLFNTDGSLAPRPTISSAPANLGYGESFIIGTPVPGGISSVCLIRPAAVTHSFDQNGRYVPLASEVLPDGSGLRVLAPTNGSIAPPGDYLLFILDFPGVPSIAKWIHLGNCASVPCDVDPPPAVGDLYVDIVGPSEIWLAWSAPGDDRNPALGIYDMRYSASPITNEREFAAATPVGAPYPPPTAPGPLGAGQSCAKDGLSSCTTYYFALKTRDGVTNWSTMATLEAGTSCDGGWGGNSAQRVAGAQQAGRTTNAALTASVTTASDSATAGPDSTTTSTESGVLVAETQRTVTGSWQVTLRLLSAVDGVDDADAGAIVSQVRGSNGAWRTLGRYHPSAGQSPLGVCALRQQGRVVFPVGYGVDQVASGLRSDGQVFGLATAEHSRLGALGDNALAITGAVEMAVGDALTATYAPTTGADAITPSWYLLLRPAGAMRTQLALTHREGAMDLPAEFALHRNRPNPFTRSTTIGFDLPVASPVSLEVFDLLGRRVATLARGQYPAGRHMAVWNLREGSGASVHPGIYVYRLEAGTFRARQKLSVLQ